MFIQYIVEKILRLDEMLSKPGYFNMSLLYGKKEVKAKEYDLNLNETADVTDQEAEDEQKGDYGDTAAPMVAADFDMEDGPDDDAQGIHVGDELGL
jgi:hypothetical protein